MKIIIEKDKYGNVLRHLAQDTDYIRETIYKYNCQGDMTSRETYNKDGVLLDSNTIYNEYDSEGNLSYKKDTFLIYDEISKNLIRTHVSEHVYDNIYDDNRLLIEIISSYLSPAIHDELQEPSKQLDKIVSYKEKFYYHNNLLVKKEHIDNQMNRIPVYISTFKYGDFNKIAEEQVCLDNGVLSYYVLYKYIDNNRYCKTIIGPSRTHHGWKIDSLNDDTCVISFKEKCCIIELVEDVITYILTTYPIVREFIISLNDAEDYTYNELIQKKLSEYQDVHNIKISLIP